MHYFYLALAIISEVVATTSLKSTAEFSRLWPSIVVFVGYGVSFYFMTLSMRVIPVGIAYAIWAGGGVVLVAIAAAFLYKQIPDLAAIIGILLIVSGVATIQIFSKTGGH